MDSTIGTVLTETDTTTGPRPHVYSVLDHTPQILNDNGFMQRCNVLCRTPRDARAVITDVESSSSLVPRFRFCNETLHALDERKVLPSLHSRDSVELCRLAAGKRCLAQRWLASRILLTHVIVRQSLFFSGQDSTVCTSVLLSRGLAVCRPQGTLAKFQRLNSYLPVGVSVLLQSVPRSRILG